jgi:REP element-mobilizing transposase RayT
MNVDPDDRDCRVGRPEFGTPVRSFQTTRRKLPHWEEAGSAYFVTWGTAHKTCLTPAERALALQAILHWDRVRWTVYAAVVMPDHVHALVQPLPVGDDGAAGCHALGSIVHSVKSYSAHEVNRRRCAAGPVWQAEREDRVVRNEHEFWQKWQYIRDNPVTDGLASSAEEYPWFYQQSGLEKEPSGSPVLLDG